MNYMYIKMSASVSYRLEHNVDRAKNVDHSLNVFHILFVRKKPKILLHVAVSKIMEYKGTHDYVLLRLRLLVYQKIDLRTDEASGNNQSKTLDLKTICVV